jgi:hypothetical protein
VKIIFTTSNKKFFAAKMNTTGGFGNWNVTQGDLKQQYATLTDNSLLLVDGKRNEMIRKPRWNPVKLSMNCTSLSHSVFVLTIKL